MSEAYTPENQRWPEGRDTGYSPLLGDDKAGQGSRGESGYQMLTVFERSHIPLTK